MEKLTNLTKENFWNELSQKYPKGMKVFCDWIDRRVLFFVPLFFIEEDITDKIEVFFHERVGKDLKEIAKILF